MLQRKIVVPKRRILIPRMVIRERRAPPPRVGVRLRPQHLRYEVGRYRERLRSGPGGLGRGRVWTPERVGEQHNQILNNAFELIATYGFSSLANYAAVGTGSTAPAATDTQLAAELVRTNNDPGGSGISRIADAQYQITRVRQFTSAQVGGQNLAEWGWAPTGTANNPDLMTRELFRDSGGTPVTLTLATDQELRLIYSYQVTLGPITQAVSLAITNIGTITGTLALYRYYSIGLTTKDNMDLAAFDRFAKGQALAAFVDNLANPGWTYNSNIANWGSVTTINASPDPYTAGSRQRVYPSITFQANQANIGITRYALRLGTGSGAGSDCPIQIWFDTPISKDNLHKLIFDPWTLTW